MKKQIKKVAIISTIALTLAIGFAFSNSKNNNTPVECQYGQCSYTIQKSDGTYRQCKNCCQQGSVYCWSHRQ